jgi:hypothetical protein
MGKFSQHLLFFPRHSQRKEGGGAKQLPPMSSAILCEDLIVKRSPAYEFCAEETSKLRRVISDVCESAGLVVPVVRRRAKEMQVLGVVDGQVLLDYYMSCANTSRAHQRRASMNLTSNSSNSSNSGPSDLFLPMHADMTQVTELAWAHTPLPMLNPSDTLVKCVGSFAHHAHHVGIWRRMPGSESPVIGTILNLWDMLCVLQKMHATERQLYPQRFMDRTLQDMHALQPYEGAFFLQQTTLLQTLQGWKQAHTREIPDVSIPIYTDDGQFVDALTLQHHLLRFLIAPSMHGFDRPVGDWLNNPTTIIVPSTTTLFPSISISGSRRLSLPLLIEPTPESVHMVQAMYAEWSCITSDVPVAHPGLSELSSPRRRRTSLANTSTLLLPVILSPTSASRASVIHEQPLSPMSPGSRSSSSSSSSSTQSSNKRVLIECTATIAQAIAQMVRHRLTCLWCIDTKTGRATSYITATRILMDVERFSQ